MSAHENLQPGQFPDKFAEAIARGKARPPKVYPPEPIDAAIDSYPQQIRMQSEGETQAPYNAASMAEIYQPRVRQLMDLQGQGFTHARWEPDAGNWVGHVPESPEVRGQR